MTAKDPEPASGAKGARPRTATGRKPAPRKAAAPPTQPRRVPPPEQSAADAGWRTGLGSLLRGSGGVLGQISGIDGPARSLERLARSAEQAGAMLERVDAEIGIERILGLFEHVERLTVAAEELRDLSRDMRRSIREVEERVVDLHMRLSPPLDRLPLTRRRRPPDAPTQEV